MDSYDIVFHDLTGYSVIHTNNSPLHSGSVYVRGCVSREEAEMLVAKWSTQPTQFYVVARHGTAGFGESYGLVDIEVCRGDDEPRRDMTTTVWGPFPTLAVCRKVKHCEIDPRNNYSD